MRKLLLFGLVMLIIASITIADRGGFKDDIDTFIQQTTFMIIRLSNNQDYLWDRVDDLTIHSRQIDYNKGDISELRNKMYYLEYELCQRDNTYSFCEELCSIDPPYSWCP